MEGASALACAERQAWDNCQTACVSSLDAGFLPLRGMLSLSSAVKGPQMRLVTQLVTCTGSTLAEPSTTRPYALPARRDIPLKILSMKLVQNAGVS